MIEEIEEEDPLKAIPETTWRRFAGACGRVLPVLRGYARRHRRQFSWGLAAALVVVAIRLTLPWLVHAILAPWLSGDRAAVRVGEGGWVFFGGIGGLFAVLAAGLGYADHRSRLGFARFAIATVRDLRAAAFEASLLQRSKLSARSGDFVARLVGDTARVKAGLKGFFTHVATNGVLFVGVSVILMVVDFWLGLVFALSVAVLGIVTARCAAAIYCRALRYRKKEGRLAETVRAASATLAPTRGFKRFNRSSGRHEASLTRIQGLATWTAHGLFGLAVATVLILGIHRVHTGTLTPGKLLIFILYALSIRAPMVQLGRQGSRIGKILGAAERVCEIVAGRRPPAERRVLPPPESRVELTGVKVVGPKRTGRKRRLRKVDLALEVGSRVLVVGPSGSGKSTLLDVLASRARPKKGQVVWDGIEVEREHGARLARHVAHLAHRVEWPRQVLRDYLRLPAGRLSESRRSVLEQLGVSGLVDSLPAGLDTPLASSELAVGECRRLALARIALGEEPLVLLDDPLPALSKSKTRRLLEVVLESRPDATVVVTARKPFGADMFDEIVTLKKGKLVSVRPTGADRSSSRPGPRIAAATPAGKENSHG